MAIGKHGAMATTPSPTVGPLDSSPDHSGIRLGRREVGVLLLGAAVYFGGRLIVQGSEARATRNAERLIELEQTIGIDIEASVQRFTLENGWFETLGNLSYVWLHWPLLLATLFVLFRIDFGHYRQLRNALFVSGSVGLFCFAVFPMAPPRFMPEFGFVGTVSDDARRHFLPYPIDWANKFAAFPSFHVGWTLIACMALAASLRRPDLRALALIPAALVGISVVSTGNHYIIDAVVGGAIALGAYLWLAPSRASAE